MTYLSYTGYKVESSCSYCYWLSYVRDPNVNPIELPLDNCVNSLFGSIVGKIFEDFYNDEIWKNGSKAESVLLERVDSAYSHVIRDNLRPNWKTKEVTSCVKWGDEDIHANYKSKDQLLEDVREAVVRGVSIIRTYRLLGPYAKSEVKLDLSRGGDLVGGRADFIIDRTRPHNDRIILDGKGTKNPQWVDPNQLRWYGMLHRERYGKAPDRMGFLLWRFDPMKSIDWLSYSSRDLDDMRDSVIDALDRIQVKTSRLSKVSTLGQVQKVFRPKPSDDACRFCRYARSDICSEGSPIADRLRRKAAERKRRKVR